MPKKKKVLVIEDDPLLLELMTDMCDEIGVSVLPAMDGTEGLRRAVEDCPDAIAVDFRLPDMSGLDVLARLQERESTKGMPTIFISADAKMHEQEARSRGACGVLNKPVSSADLRAALEQCLGKL